MHLVIPMSTVSSALQVSCGSTAHTLPRNMTTYTYISNRAYVVVGYLEGVLAIGKDEDAAMRVKPADW